MTDTCQAYASKSPPEVEVEGTLETKSNVPPPPGSAPGSDRQAPKKAPKKPPREHWQAMVDHVCGTITRKKGLTKPFKPSHHDLGILAHLYDAYYPETVMACWDLWWETGHNWSEWAGRTGRSIEGFSRGILSILDDTRYKAKAERYRNAWGTGAAQVMDALVKTAV